MSDVNPLHSRAAAAGTIAELERALATAIRERDEARDNGLEQAAFMTDGLAAKHWQAARTNEADEDVTLAVDLAMTCRRCSECPGAEHHWMDSVYGDEPVGPGSPSHVCKHCDATGDECEACDGEGGEVVDIGERFNGGVALCPPCKGHGVIERGRQTI